MIKAIITTLIKEHLSKVNIEDKINKAVEIYIQEGIRKADVRKNIFATIEEEVSKEIRFWNSGSGETRTVIRDIVSSEILRAIKYILTNSITLADIEKMKPEQIKNLLSKR